MGMYAVFAGMDRYAGRMIRFPLMTSSMRCAHQPAPLAMANSGDYTLGEAIIAYATACERCMNVLSYKYTDGKEGYEEFSDEWKKCRTVCDFCRHEGYQRRSSATVESEAKEE